MENKTQDSDQDGEAHDEANTCFKCEQPEVDPADPLHSATQVKYDSLVKSLNILNDDNLKERNQKAWKAKSLYYHERCGKEIYNQVKKITRANSKSGKCSHCCEIKIILSSI